MSHGKSSFWVYTWNNPNLSPDSHNDSFSSLGCTFHVFQREKGEEGTEHFQGYVELSSARGLTAIKAVNPQIHWERRRGTQAQAIDYCSKEESRVEGPWRFGEPRRQNNTGMSAGFPDAIKEGKRMRQLFDEYPDDMRKYPRYAESLRQVFPPSQRDSAPDVILLIGPPGAGKTRYVRDLNSTEELYVKPCDRDFWMNGYDLHPAVLLDDFAGASKIGRASCRERV